MICLAVNTANRLMSVALVRESGETLSFFRTSETRNQGNLLLSHIQQAMTAAGLGYGDIGLLAAVTGPGSFTGIRIGLAAMHGMAIATGLPLIGLSSFDLYDADIVAIESWREELYLRKKGEKPVNETAAIFSRRFADKNAPVTVAGDAAEKIKSFFSNARIITEEKTAAHVGGLAIEKFRSEGADDLPVPFYLRDADVSFSKNPGRKTEGIS